MAVIRTPPNLFVRPRIPVSNKELAMTLLISNLLLPISLLLACSVFFFYWKGLSVQHIFYANFSISNITLMASLCISVFLASVLMIIFNITDRILDENLQSGVAIMASLGFFIFNLFSFGLFSDSIISNPSLNNDIIKSQWYGVGAFACYLLFGTIIYAISKFLEFKGLISNRFNLILIILSQFFLLGVTSIVFGAIIWDKMPTRFIANINADHLSLLSSLLINLFIFSFVYFLFSKFGDRHRLTQNETLLASGLIIVLSSYFLSTIIKKDIGNSYISNYEVVQHYNIFGGVTISSILVCFGLLFFIKRILSY